MYLFCRNNYDSFEDFVPVNSHRLCFFMLGNPFDWIDLYVCYGLEQHTPVRGAGNYGHLQIVELLMAAGKSYSIPTRYC
jgi:hypothetical protein